VDGPGDAGDETSPDDDHSDQHEDQCAPAHQTIASSGRSINLSFQLFRVNLLVAALRRRCPIGWSISPRAETYLLMTDSLTLCLDRS
jgi:hypothetical protein